MNKRISMARYQLACGDRYKDKNRGLKQVRIDAEGIYGGGVMI